MLFFPGLLTTSLLWRICGSFPVAIYVRSAGTGIDLSSSDLILVRGGEFGPVTFPAFKAGVSALRGSKGEFDSHTLPPSIFD